MLFQSFVTFHKIFSSFNFPYNAFKNIPCISCRVAALSNRFYSLDAKYTNEQKEKIISVLNESDKDLLSRYDITKGRIKYFSQWKQSNGTLKTLTDVEFIQGFSEKTAKKLFDSILKGPVEKVPNISNKIKGQIVNPNLSPADIKNTKSVLTVYTTVNSVSWMLIDRQKYEVLDWQYHGILHQEGKKLQVSDILDIAWEVCQRLPVADLYVMQGERTSLRASGSDPHSPRVLAVNLQKAQMVAIIVALLQARHAAESEQSPDSDAPTKLKHRVFFLRPTLPYRLYGTLVGNERVSTEQTVEMLLHPNRQSQVTLPQRLRDMYHCQKDLQKDMLGHCLLLGLTFMDLCIYKDEVRIAQLLQERNI